MGRLECTHKVATDYIVQEASVAGKRLWRCSGCKVVGSWQPDWTYYGNIECRWCQAQAIDAVYCGACAKTIDLTRPPTRRKRRSPHDQAPEHGAKEKER
jgi:hypothetical protein